jgi:hypothetical protein
MSTDAHIVDPLADLTQKITGSDPSITITDNPKAPPLPTIKPVGGLFDSQNITATVESVLERVKINGVSPTFKGNSIDFELPKPPAMSPTPIISSVTNYPIQLPLPAPLVAPAPPPIQDPPNESHSRNSVRATVNSDPVITNVSSSPRQIYGNEVAVGVASLETYGDPSDTTPPLDLVRQKGGSSTIDELSNRVIDNGAGDIPRNSENDYKLDAEASTVFPIKLVRGDGEKVCLAYVRAEASFVVEKASGDDHTTDNPEPAFYYTADGSNVHHPWKVSFASNNEDETKSWKVVGGTVYTQGSPITVEDTEITGDAGYILLKIVRDGDSREMTEAVVEFAATVTESDYSNQYRVLAYVDSEGDNQVTQYQFEEIRIFEDLAIVNGEFQLVGLEMSHRNYYAPP